MIKNKYLTFMAAGLSLAITSTYAVEGDVEAGKEASMLCMACHQADGSGMNIPGGESWPALAGISASYMYKQLQDFKSGARTNATMLPFVNMLSEQQMRDISVYYSSLPATQGKGGDNATEAELRRGAQLAQNGDWDEYIVPCMSCHGPDNQGAGDHFPSIAGQHAGYIADQLNAWKNGERSNDPQELMLAIAERMSDEDVRAVSLWLSRQPASAEQQ